MIYLYAWGLFTILLLVFTLSRPHPYRFSRFLVFESILSLLFLNGDLWFQDPFSFVQLVSWLSLVGSIVLSVHGFVLIKTRGHSKGDFEDTTKLITSGAYRYIRHPLYTSLFLFGFGAFLKDPSFLGAGLMVSTFFGVVVTALIEEKHNLERFGEEYLIYSQRTKRFVPYIF